MGIRGGAGGLGGGMYGMAKLVCGRTNYDQASFNIALASQRSTPIHFCKLGVAIKINCKVEVILMRMRRTSSCCFRFSKDDLQRETSGGLETLLEVSL